MERDQHEGRLELDLSGVTTKGRAGYYVSDLSAHIVFTPEVLNERPKSSNRRVDDVAQLSDIVSFAHNDTFGWTED